MAQTVDARLRAALERQLEAWRAALDSGAQRVGWKLGMGERERIGSGPVIGHLTSASQLPPGGVYCGPPGELAADAEVALLIGHDGSIAGYGAALEIVDLADDGDAEAIVAANVFHRAVALSPAIGELPREGVEASLIVNGERVGAGRSDAELPGRVRVVADLLRELGEELRPGDWLITGSVVQAGIPPGAEVVADLGALGAIGLTVSQTGAAHCQ